MDVPKIPPPELRSPNCTMVAEVLSRIGDKWTILVIGLLQERSWRFNEMKRQIGVSQQMLARTLRALDRDGIVTRTVTAAVPPQVSYSLTPLGASLAEPLAQVGMWVVRHVGDIERNRRIADVAASGPAAQITAFRSPSDTASVSFPTEPILVFPPPSD